MNPSLILYFLPLSDLDEGTWRLQHVRVSVGGQRPAEEGGTEVDGDAGEPDHEQAEGDALRAVLQERESVLRVLVG